MILAISAEQTMYAKASRDVIKTLDVEISGNEALQDPKASVVVLVEPNVQRSRAAENKEIIIERTWEALATGASIDCGRFPFVSPWWNRWRKE